MTLGGLILEAEKRLRAARLFYGHGTTNPRDEAAFLVLRSLRLPFETSLRKTASPRQEKHIESLVRKRIEKRVPVPYLLNEAWLADRRFYVDRRVIVPRSHIAELLEAKLRPWLQVPPRRILDLCTGSGCLAILAALAFPRARVDAVDLSKPALAVAAKNVAAYRLGKRLRLIHSDLFDAIADETYDAIITNPPYVTSKAMKALPPEYRHEPGLALGGGQDGLALVRKILRQAPRHLSPRGLLVCEIGAGRKALERAYPRLDFFWPETAAGAGHVFVLQAPFG